MGDQEPQQTEKAAKSITPTWGQSLLVDKAEEVLIEVWATVGTQERFLGEATIKVPAGQRPGCGAVLGCVQDALCRLRVFSGVLVCVFSRVLICPYQGRGTQERFTGEAATAVGRGFARFAVDRTV